MDGRLQAGDHILEVLYIYMYIHTYIHIYLQYIYTYIYVAYYKIVVFFNNYKYGF